MQNETHFILAVAGLVLPMLMACAASSGPFTPGPLKPCPDSPNCVSSADDRPGHQVAPLTYQGDWQAARQRLAELLARLPRTRVRQADGRYIHAESRSRIFRFVDDVEFYFDPDQPVIQIRSASRIGYSDFRVNHKRVAKIREMWETQDER